ncbi:MAG: hypothetical protein ABW360_15495 [Phenylobacterium sp.]
MTNDTPHISRLDRLADRLGEYAWQASVFAVFMYVIALIDRDGGGVGWAIVFWLAIYLFVAPFIVRRVATRTPSGDHWRAAAVLAYGAFPFSVLVPWWRELTAWPVAIAVFPVLFAWGLAAQIIALRDKGPVRPPRVRALMLAGGGAICGAVALPLFGGAGIGLLMGVWEPPPGAALISPLIILLCLPLALATGYASLKLFGAAARAYAGETP